MSIKIVLLLISFISLFAQSTPHLFSSLGNKLYNANTQFNIFTDYTPLSNQIHSYQVQCDTLRENGFELESKANITDTERDNYLTSLRLLEENYIHIVRKLQHLLLKSIDSNDYNTFQQIANTSIHDLWQSSTLNRQAIAYYQQHKDKGTIQSLEQLIKNQKIEREVVSASKTAKILTNNGGDYPKAIALFVKACDGGYYRACTNLGNAYFRGKGVPQDSATAIKYYSKACLGADANGCRNLGNAYVHGIGVTKDFAKAADIYTISCALGNSDACINLGTLYYRGEGVPKDRDIAMQFYKNACDSGNNRGCSNLGSLYYIGK